MTARVEVIGLPAGRAARLRVDARVAIRRWPRCRHA